MKILLGTNTFSKYTRQDVAVESYKNLKTLFPDILDIVDIQFSDEKEKFENSYGLPVKFDLNRSSLDVIEGGQKKLPFVNDLFSVLANHSEEYCIFTNSDIIINKNLIKYIIDKKPQCFACSRLEIEEVQNFHELKNKIKPIRWEIAGFDVFIFRKDWYLKNKNLFNDYLMGRPEFDHVYAGLMKCFGDNTPIGNQYPPFCFHMMHKNNWLDDSKETEYNRKMLESNPLDQTMSNVMFFNLKYNLCKREPWGLFLHPSEHELQQEQTFFNIFNVNIKNSL